MDKREIVQYHFTSWPDHWVPRDTAGFLMFHHKLKQVLRIDPGPVIVHCRSVVIQTTLGYVMYPRLVVCCETWYVRVRTTLELLCFSAHWHIFSENTENCFWASTTLQSKVERTQATYRAFSLTWQAAISVHSNKSRFLRKKRVQLPKDCIGTPTWPPFFVLEHQYGRRDVTWKRSTVLLVLACASLFSLDYNLFPQLKLTTRPRGGGGGVVLGSIITWRPFLCFGTPIWPPWRHVKTLHLILILCYNG